MTVAPRDDRRLELVVEITSADGTTYRWDPRGRAKNRPQSISFDTRRGDGFLTCTLSLARRIDTDYNDLRLLDDIRILAGDGVVVWEGRVADLPRSMDTTHTITVDGVGWMASGRDVTFLENFVNRDMGAWGDISITRQASLAIASVTLGSISPAGDGSGISWQIPNQALPINSDGEIQYRSAPGVKVAKVAYRGQRAGTWTSFEAPTLYASDDKDMAASDTQALTLDSTLRTATLSTARQNLMLRAFTTAAVTPPVGTLQSFDMLATYGNHGLSTHAISGEPDGVYGSDVMINIAQRFCPKLNTSGVSGTSYPIAHLVFSSDTAPYDAWAQINNYHLWELGVWENKTLTWGPIDLTDYDWQVRLDDRNVQVQLQGDTAQDLVNGIVVNYTDAATGLPGRLSPVDHPELLITDPNNEANRHGNPIYPPITLSYPTNADGALQIGRAAVAEYQLPKSPGTITVKGWIRDRAGHEQPVSRVKASQRIAIVNHPNNRPRLISATRCSQGDSLTNEITVEGTPRRLDAYFARLGIRP